MNIIEITAANAKEFLIDESFKRPVVVDFWAEWSALCKSVKPLLGVPEHFRQMLHRLAVAQS